MDRPLPVLFPVSLLFLLSVAPAVAVSQDFTKCLMQDGSVEYTDQTCPAGSTEVTLSSAARKEPPYESKSGAPAREVEEATRSIPVEEPEEVMARPTAVPQSETKKAWNRLCWYNGLRQ